MRTVIWSRDALDDIKSVVRHIAEDKGSFALTIADRLERSANLLSTFATGRAGRAAGTYEKPVSDLPYTIAYLIEVRSDGAEQVVILRIIHDARSWTSDAWPD